MKRVCGIWGILVLLALFQVAATPAAADVEVIPWVVPAEPAAPVELPRLKQPLVLDGELREWENTACVPIRDPSYLWRLIPPREWNGPADAGMEVYCAWNDEGLCFAAAVTDDDVRVATGIHRRNHARFYKEDLVQFFVDGRSAERLMEPFVSKGVCTISVKPPRADGPPEIFVDEPVGKSIEGLEVAGKRTSAGYVIEALVPWSGFPDFVAKVDAEIGLQFRLNDYDVRSAKDDYPAALTWQHAWLDDSPQNFIKWVLVDVNRLVDFARKTLPDASERLAAVDLASLSRTDPFKAAAYLGAAACLERLESSMQPPMDAATAAAAAQAAQELVARLQLLEEGELEPKPPGLCDLLVLAADPAAQIVVEYPRPDYASVTCYWGPIPLVVTGVRQAANEEQAKAALTEIRDWPLAPVTRSVTVAGKPALFIRGVDLVPFYLGDFAPERQVMTVHLSDHNGAVVSVDQLSSLEVDGVLILTDCPAAVRQAVEAWAEQQKLSLMASEEASKCERLLIAGDVRSAEAEPIVGTLDIFAPVLAPPPGYLIVASGDRVISVDSPVEEVSTGAAELVIAGEPISPEDVDELRRALVKALAPAAPAPAVPEWMNLYCGDVHMHTFYSDGATSPAGLMLEAIYCYLDFAVVTDHNTIEGALLAQKQLAECGFSYPVIVGEEITNETFHMNAYPLQEVVPPGLSPDETIKAAHAQGAVIQWNHPWAAEGDEWTYKHFNEGIASTGLDAWEHYPIRYDEWKAAGTLPLIVGSTDTHSGTFDWPERTIILAPSAHGEEVAEAIGSRQAVALMPYDRFLCGPNDSVAAIVWEALAEGEALKEATKQRLRHILQNADLAGLLKASLPYPVLPD